MASESSQIASWLVDLDEENQDQATCDNICFGPLVAEIMGEKQMVGKRGRELNPPHHHRITSMIQLGAKIKITVVYMKIG